MRLRLSHLTRYEYSHEVSFSPHTLFLRPREGALLRLLRFSLNLNPAAKLTWLRDADGNTQARAYFWDKASSLSVRAECEVETYETNPFDFLLADHAAGFPFRYEPADRAALAVYLAPPDADTQAHLQAWLHDRLPSLPRETVPAVTALNQALHQGLAYRRRSESGVQSAVQTLTDGGGSCRDYAQAGVELCRTLGLAARFVSGYLHDPEEALSSASAAPEFSTPTEASESPAEQSASSLHAWFEVYLPGAGWKGLDPTHGIFCQDQFIPVAAAASPERVSPVQGFFQGPPGVTSRLHTRVTAEKSG